MIIGIGLFLAIIMGILGRYVAKEKNRSKSEGFWLGFLFSIFGVIIVALLPNKEEEIPVELTDEEKKEIQLEREKGLRGLKQIRNFIFAVTFLLIILALIKSYF